jgi:hypothetical protein
MCAKSAYGVRSKRKGSPSVGSMNATRSAAANDRNASM